MMPIAIQMASTNERVKIPHFQIRSTFEINFIAAAISKNPIATFTLFIQPPARGSCETSCGASASTKNGSAKTVENASIPTSGNCQLPCADETMIEPINGDVQVKLVKVNVKPISKAPI